jgi:hypothetical protein
MNRLTKILIIGALVMASAAAVIGSGAAPAGATYIDLHRYSASSAIDSTNAKSVTLTCPWGRYVSGTGAQVNIAETGKAGLVSITPLPGGNAVTAVAAETGAGTDQNWSVKVYAMCIEQVFGLYDGYTTSTISSASSRGVNVACPANWQVVGAGGTVSTPDTGRVFLNSMIPNPGNTSVYVSAREVGAGTANNWYLKGYVICAHPSAPYIPSYSKTSAFDSTHAKSVTVYCPAGRQLVGTGFALLTQNADSKVIIDEVTPLPDLSGATVVASETAGGTAKNWHVTATALCTVAT